MAASSLANYNYHGANQSVDTDTTDILSSKIDNAKKSFKNVRSKRI